MFLTLRTKTLWNRLASRDISLPASSPHHRTRSLFLRALGLIYLVAFAAALRQAAPLIGRDGLLPAHLFLARLKQIHDSTWDAFWDAPSLFWLAPTDPTLTVLGAAGLGASLVLLSGRGNAPLLALLWLLYMSIYQVGQLFYGYGWEILLLETGFLSIFFAPLWRATTTTVAVVWLYRWLLFRLMFGAGLIKLRGDTCWTDLTCLIYHYETQPIPNPLSWYLHQLPAWVHQGGVLFNHLVELLVPFFYFAPRRLRHLAGLLTIAFQSLLILSGNLAFLNYLTLILCIPLFDDQALAALVPTRWRRKAPVLAPVHPARRPVLTALVALLSIQPVLNLLSPHQAMNRSFDPLHLVNTYGAFGHIGKERREVIIQGTYDPVVDDNTRWLDYEFKHKPGALDRRPPIIAPYQPRLDWQIWFAAMSDYRRQPWLIHLVYKLLTDDPGIQSLLGPHPFTQGPPTFIRAELYQYRFTGPGDDIPAWWTRRRLGPYLPPLSATNPDLLRIIDSFGWPRKSTPDKAP
ncbi:MAG: lipase maturation factor family protein [Candidatus Latescibacteria bacterium]|nr:lipase maturation factor family protein [Candidatus Latescibacterota bacterium]